MENPSTSENDLPMEKKQKLELEDISVYAGSVLIDQDSKLFDEEGFVLYMAKQLDPRFLTIKVTLKQGTKPVLKSMEGVLEIVFMTLLDVLKRMYRNEPSYCHLSVNQKSMSTSLTLASFSLQSNETENIQNILKRFLQSHPTLRLDCSFSAHFHLVPSKIHCRRCLRSESEPDLRVNLTCLPDLPVLKIASYLGDTKNLINFSHSCKNVNRICEGDSTVWARALKHDEQNFRNQFREIAASIARKQILFATRNVDKLAVFIYKKTLQNWRYYGPVDAKRISLFRTLYPKLYNHSNCIVACWPERAHKNHLTIWDVRTGSEKLFTVPKRKFWVYEIHLFDRFILVISDTPDHARGTVHQELTYFKINKEAFVEVWRAEHEYHGSRMCCSVFKAFYVNYVNPTERDKNKEILVEGFRTANGSKLFSYKFDVSEPHFPTLAGGSGSGWFVVYLPSRIIAINWKTNSWKVLKRGSIHLEKLIVKQDKVLCVYKSGNANLVNLSSGHVLRYINVFQTNQTPRIYFDHVTDTVTSLFKSLRGNYWAKKTFSGPGTATISKYRCENDNIALKNCHLMFGNLVMLEMTISEDSCSFKVAIQEGNEWIEVFEKWGNWNDCITKCTPFFVVIKDKWDCRIYDYVNIKQYLESS